MEVDALLVEVSEMDEITFWCRQVAEHALFIVKGLEAGRTELTRLGLDYFLEDGMELYERWDNLFQRRLQGEDALEEITNLLIIFRNYLQEVGQQTNIIWLGYVYPSQITHFLEELDHFESVIKNEEISPEKLAHFWSEIHKDHAALFARLLDPSEEENFKESLLYQQLFQENIDNPSIEIEDFLDLSQKVSNFNTFTATLREKQATSYLKSIIHPRLALHIHREGLRALVELNDLINQA